MSVGSDEAVKKWRERNIKFRKMNILEKGSMMFGIFELLSGFIIVVLLAPLYLIMQDYNLVILFLILSKLILLCGLVMLSPFFEYVKTFSKLYGEMKK